MVPEPLNISYRKTNIGNGDDIGECKYYNLAGIEGLMSNDNNSWKKQQLYNSICEIYTMRQAWKMWMMRRVGRSTIALTDKWDSAVGAGGNEEWERQHYGFWKDIVRKACRQEHVRRDDERQIAQAIC